jgi:FKBP-type peptidyl-prolyl cis-trans isomerase 2
MIPGFEQEVLGAKVREKREFTLTPDRAYGERDDDAIQKIERSQFPEGMELEVGMVVGAHSDQGPIQFTITEIDGDVVSADFNHQMAGKTLRFEVEVVEIRTGAWARPRPRRTSSLAPSEVLSPPPIIRLG